MNISDLVKAELVRVKAKATAAEARLREDAGLTSLATIQVMSVLCKKLNINIYSLSERDFAKVKTIGDLVDMLSEKSSPA